MKNLLLTLMLGAAAAPAAMAQARAGGDLSSKDYTGGAVTDSRNTGFGIKGGYNLSNLYGGGKGLLNPDYINAFHGGVYGQFGFNQVSSVQVELLYTRKGYIANFAGGAYNESQRTTRLNYLQLPVLYVANFTKNLSFHIGPQVSLLTNARVYDQDLALSAGGFNSLDYGAVAGFEGRVGPARIGVRYDLGLGNVYKDGVSIKYGGNTVANLTNSNLHNQTFQVYLGLGFTQ
ncbi:porin family protein [Hymenobacter sp. PAMC 26628]|uniref:porin family protein n=1 Tax=Hymenobacter sp. PAMC 26628 TaxID=1484118 RepID=UPI0009E9CD65|nr:porin family protein [Hymenobacter sp. PAMC 26628]